MLGTLKYEMKMRKSFWREGARGAGVGEGE